MRKLTFRIGGIHPPQMKYTAGQPISLFPLPMKATVPLSQHIGVPATPCVAAGDTVERGQIVGKPSGRISSSIHSPITGTVRSVGTATDDKGYPVPAIIIEASAEQHEADTRRREEIYASLEKNVRRDLSETLDAAAIREIIEEKGVVGLGGATFPSQVKLGLPGGVKAEVLIVNACECEPMLTCDDALMRTWPGCIAEGVELVMKACGAPRAIIGIEDNKPEAAHALREAIPAGYPIEVLVLKTKYPQGGEKQLVQAVTGKYIPSGALPAAVGAVVHNVATIFAAYMAVALGVPLTDRVVTLTGANSLKGNFLVATGTPLSELLRDTPAASEIVVGGPMMGHSAIATDAPVIKSTSGVVVFDAGTETRAVSPCLRCGKCVSVCPMGLEPYLIATYGRQGRWEDAADHAATDCIECGSCSYICPSGRPIVDYIRVAKNRLRALIGKNK